MARKSSRNRSNRMKRDVITPITSRLPPRPLLHRPIFTSLLPIEDNRLHTPFRSLSTTSRRTIHASPVSTVRRAYRSAMRGYMPRVLDTLPRDAVVCVRRKVRKEVIFASGRGGARGSQRRHRRNENSQIVCRRK